MVDPGKKVPGEHEHDLDVAEWFFGNMEVAHVFSFTEANHVIQDGFLVDHEDRLALGDISHAAVGEQVVQREQVFLPQCSPDLLHSRRFGPLVGWEQYFITELTNPHRKKRK